MTEDGSTPTEERSTVPAVPATPTDWVEVPGGRVACWQVGEGSGRPLLCLHGGPGLPHDYLTPLAQLVPERAVIFYDQLGCGQSERPDDVSLWTLERSVVELLEVVAAFHLTDFHLFGNSFGGWLALQAVLEAKVAPRSLVLSSSPASIPRWIEDCARLCRSLPEAVQQIIRDHEEQGFFTCPEFVAAIWEFYRRHLCRLTPWPEELERAFAGFGGAVYETMWGASEFGPVTGVLKDWDVTDRLGEIGIPALVTVGRFDEATPEHVEILAEGLRDAELVVFEKSAHLAFLEERADYLNVLGRFLRRVEADPR